MRKTASATLGLAFVVFLLGLLFAGLPAADIPGFLWRTVASGTAMPLNPHECEFDGAIAFSGNASERQLGIGHDTTTR